MGVSILNVNFWILKFTHRRGFEPTISRAKVFDANHYTMKAGLLCSILAFIDMMLSQVQPTLSDKNAFAEFDPGHIGKVNTEILRYYQHLFNTQLHLFKKVA